MRRSVAILCAAAMLPVLLSSCGSSSGSSSGNESRVELTKNGKIIEYTVEDFSAPNYDLDELKTFVDDQIKSFRQENKGRIRARRVKEKKNMVYLTVRYNNIDTYSAFVGEECFSGTMEEALEAGYDFSMDFFAAGTGSVEETEDLSMEPEEPEVQTVSGNSLTADEDLHVLIIGTDASVQVSGDVRYYYVSHGEAACTGRNLVSVSVDEDAEELGNLVYVLYNE